MDKRLFGPVALALALALSFCLAGCMSDNLQRDSEVSSSEAAQEEQESAATAEESEAAEEPAGPVTETCPLFRLTLPPETAENLTFEHEYDNCLTAYCNGTAVFELACYDTFERSGEERKHRDYDCGFGADEQGWHKVMLSFFYMAADNSSLAHWGDKDATTLAVSYLAGVSEQDILDGVELQVASGDNVTKAKWRESYPTLELDDPEAQAKEVAEANARKQAEQARIAEEKAREEAEQKAREEKEKSREKEKSTSSSNESGFYGVWIAACKDPGNADAFASQARNAGFGGAEVLTSTDWTGLNPERWYVVTLGRYGSQSDAEAVLSKAKKAGFGDAYVNYTGDHR